MTHNEIILSLSSISESNSNPCLCLEQALENIRRLFHETSLLSLVALLPAKKQAAGKPFSWRCLNRELLISGQRWNDLAAHTMLG